MYYFNKKSFAPLGLVGLFVLLNPSPPQPINGPCPTQPTLDSEH